MIPFDAERARSWTGGELAGDAAIRFSSVSIDTRSLAPGALYVAIRGERLDGHHFLEAALEAGAAGLVIERGRKHPTGIARRVPVLTVPDTTEALGALAAGHRAGFTGPLVAVTGSNGKTTTKEMCAAMLGQAGPCLKNRGNLNNQFGLPLTLLSRDATHESVVVEIGMNHPGEIAPLARIARPNVGVITNVGSAHIEHMGSREAIAHEKGELVAALDADATAVLNADDALTRAQARRTRARVVTFGEGADADVRAEAVQTRGARGFSFELVTPQGRRALQVAGLGRATVWNALAAAAAALAAGVDLDALAEGLARFAGVPGRMRPLLAPGELTLLDDSYNANPQSTELALRALVELAGPGRALVVLGEMGELGEHAAAAHHETGVLSARLGVARLFAVGGHAEDLARGAREGGLEPARVRVLPDAAAAAAAVRATARKGDWVLIKGSRAAGMERVVERLAQEGD